MTCDRFLLCNSLQLVATRRDATASARLLLSLSFSFTCPFALLPLDFRCSLHCVFAPHRTAPHLHCYAIAHDVLGTFCRRAIEDSFLIDSIEGRGKGPQTMKTTTLLRLTAKRSRSHKAVEWRCTRCASKCSYKITYKSGRHLRQYMRV